MKHGAATPCPSCPGVPGYVERYSARGYSYEACETCKGTGEHPKCSTCDALLTGDDLTEGAEECFSCWGAKQADECDAERHFAEVA